ncbi:MAG: TIGR04211 family SH3 domain-containing protein [Pseudomonadota bacterium]
MKKIVQSLLAIFFMLVFSIPYSLAENIYVTGVTNITMRTGPGVDHKIVLMLKSGTKLEILEHQEDWSHVQTMGGKQGWVLSRFLTPKVPDALLVEQLNIDNSKLMAKLTTIEEENKQLVIKNASLVQIEEKYNQLKEKSGQFLELEAEYKKMVAQFEDQKKRIEKLENDSSNEIKLWYLIGPGVLIIGFIFGLSTRKKKRSSLL